MLSSTFTANHIHLEIRIIEHFSQKRVILSILLDPLDPLDPRPLLAQLMVSGTLQDGLLVM